MITKIDEAELPKLSHPETKTIQKLIGAPPENNDQLAPEKPRRENSSKSGSKYLTLQVSHIHSNHIERKKKKSSIWKKNFHIFRKRKRI